MADAPPGLSQTISFVSCGVWGVQREPCLPSDPVLCSETCCSRQRSRVQHMPGLQTLCSVWRLADRRLPWGAATRNGQNACEMTKWLLQLPGEAMEQRKKPNQRAHHGVGACYLTTINPPVSAAWSVFMFFQVNYPTREPNVPCCRGQHCPTGSWWAAVHKLAPHSIFKCEWCTLPHKPIFTSPTPITPSSMDQGASFSLLNTLTNLLLAEGQGL